MKSAIITATLLMMVCTTYAADTDKTLVSWVAITDKNVRAGSVLTIQRGAEFDGIIFAERAPGKWMAGSHTFQRTQGKQDAYPTEMTDGKTLLQMAIVYRDDTISIYRNGEPYASYNAKNIDLLSGKDNFAVFGLRHRGGNGSISGSIEDARIYSKALSVDELKALKPNTESTIKPYAWWDFEDDKGADRMGRFPYTKLEGGAKIENGKLALGKDAVMFATSTKAIPGSGNRAPQMVVTGPYDPETPKWPENPPADWLTYHLAHPGPGEARPGDPNPAFFHKGRYHLHYIYRSAEGGGFAFAHVSSTDMVHWKWHPTVLVPKRTGHGMFSGTGFFTKDGRAAMIYHGQRSGRNQIAYALDDNLDKWTKPEAIEPKDQDGNLPTMRHWDPDCWQIGDTYYALSGGKDAELMKSDDLKNWTYLGKLLHDDYFSDLGVPRAEDISCANMFQIGDKWMLLCISHPLGCRYYLGDFKDEKFLPEFHAMMSWQGNNFFAPESMLAQDGRRVMWAWVRSGANPTGVQSLPRELELPQDGVLRIKPLRELQSLRYDGKVEKKMTVAAGQEVRLDGLTGDAIELEITFAAPLPKEFGVKLLGDDNGENSMSIVAGAGMKKLMVGNLDPEFALKKDEDLTLRIFIDKNLVEVFANDRQAAAYGHGHFRENPNVSLFTGDSDLVVKEVKTWKMKTIYQPDE